MRSICSACQLSVALPLLIISGCTNFAMVHGPPPPPEPEELIGTWVHISAFAADRLDLMDYGAAELVTGHRMEQNLRRYRSDNWFLDGYELFATFTPTNPNYEMVYLRATATSDRALYNVSISLDPSSRIPTNDEFTRAFTFLEWLDALAVNGTED